VLFWNDFAWPDSLNLVGKPMSQTDLELPENLEDLRAFALALQARVAAQDAVIIEAQKAQEALVAEETAHAKTRTELEAAKASIKLNGMLIEKLKAQLAKLKRMKFGQSSERLAAQIDQLELTLEDLESEEALQSCVLDLSSLRGDSIKPKRQPKRTALPHAAPDADGCSACGGNMGALGEDVTEILEYVPGRFKVVRHVRPKLACKKCDAISQAPAPSLPIPRGLAGPGLLAHVMVSKFADHLPLYRQSAIYAREGMDLSRSTLADWVGQVSWLLQPLVDAIGTHVMASIKVHADDTPVRVQAPGTGKTKTGRLWVYVRDNRSWRPTEPPAALYLYSPDRKGERPRAHLKAFAGFLQADGYAGFEQLYAPGRRPGDIHEVACWAHVRRKINDVFVADPKSLTAHSVLRAIQELYEIERRIVSEPSDDRRKARKASKLKILDFFVSAEATLAKISARTPLALALRYALNRREALLRYTDDGRLEIDNNRAENAIRGIAIGRKNWLFAGADCGGERAAAIYTLIETAKLNNVNPQIWLADVLDRIGKGHPINRIDELLPWVWTLEHSARPNSQD
jgi:transposase